MTKDVNFFESEKCPDISADEFKRLNSPEVIGQEVVLNVKGWIKNALTTLSRHSDLRPAVDLEAPEWSDLSLPDHAIHELHRVCLKLPRYMPPENRMETLTSDEKNAVEVLYRIRQLTNTVMGIGIPDTSAAASAVVIIKASFDLGFMIAEAHVAPWEPLAESGWRSKTGGGKGGKADKRRRWADVVAAYLLESCPVKSKKFIWASLEDSTDISKKDSSDISEIESDFGDIEFYKDGDKLCANIDGEPVTPMSREHFFNHYLKTRKQE